MTLEQYTIEVEWAIRTVEAMALDLERLAEENERLLASGPSLSVDRLNSRCDTL